MPEQPNDLEIILTEALKKAGEQGLLEGISDEELAHMTIQARTKAAVQETGVLNVESVNLEEVREKFSQAEAEYKQVVAEYDNAGRVPAIYNNEKLYEAIKARYSNAYDHLMKVAEEVGSVLARAWNAWRDGGPRPEGFEARYTDFPFCYLRLGKGNSGFVFPDVDALGNEFSSNLLHYFRVPVGLKPLGVKNLKLVKPAFLRDMNNRALGVTMGELGRK